MNPTKYPVDFLTQPDKAAKKYLFPKEEFDIKDLQGELEKMEGLPSDLKEYERDCKKSLHDVVEIAKRRVFEKFPGIQNMEKYSRLNDEYWVEAILQERTVNGTVDDDDYYDCDCSLGRRRLRLATVAYGGALRRSCSFPVVETDEDVELRLSELYEELGTDRSMVREAHNQWRSLGVVYRTVQNSIIGRIKEQVEHLRNQMSRSEHLNKEERWRKECEEKMEEARKLKKEKLQCLCNVMKEVLGDRVEDVVVSSKSCFPSDRTNSCYLRDSGMCGGKTMEIIPGDCIIEDLRKRCDADKKDIHVRNSTLLLFQYADLHWKTRQQEQ